MSLHKKIEINQSSLLGLKAELLRKKNEVNSTKLFPTKAFKNSRKKLVTKLDKTNEGVEERNKRDAEEIQQESDELKRASKILEAKAELYNKLADNVESVGSDIDSSNFLVDFKQKNNEGSEKPDKDVKSPESDYGEYSDDEEWVDFVDCLGRTKRCHKDDLEAMKEQDEKLKISLSNNKSAGVIEKNKESEKSEQLPQLCSEDMKKEILRQKWEQQERLLLEKKNVHYQDVLFDEARTHGVGYYGFSTDETERARQQAELRNLRKETQKLQAETQTAAQRKQKLMEKRLQAARRRKRERLGLPPEEENPEEEVKEEEEEEKPPEAPEELRRDVRKPAPLRPWDIGKEDTPKILTQEEWIEKKRAERNKEFAPLNTPVPKKRKPPKKHNQEYYKTNPTNIEDELESNNTTTRGKGIEIPPPPTFNMYGPTSFPKKNFSSLNQKTMDKSIEEGLNFLRKQVEEKQAKRRREDDIEIL